MASIPIHSLRAIDVYSALETSPQGLNAEQAAQRLSLYGPNALTGPRGVPLWRRFLGHTAHLMALLLWVAAALAFVAREPALGLVIILVVLINAGFSFWREYRAEQAMAALRRLLPTYARVLRAGAEARIFASEVVPGDVLVLAEGDSIPADARVVEEFGLRTNNTTLTGEAVPGRKVAEASLRDGLTDVERPNLVFAGTSVVSGTGRGVVYATGMLTQFGRIAHLTQAVREEPSPLQEELRRVSRVISAIAVGLGALVFIVGSLQVGMPRLEAFVLAIGILVAAVPEGLSPITTLSLAMAVQRLAQRGVLVKRLALMETLGTVSVVCTDKSGTLTQNQMTIREVWVSGERISVTGVGYEPRGEFVPQPAASGVTQELRTLLLAGSLCNNARLNPPTPDRPQWTSLGDQTEAAMRVLALKGGLDERAVAEAYPRVHELPFDARRKRMSTIHRSGGREIAFVKGAPREVLGLCTHVLRRGEVQPLDTATRSAILTANDEYARRALRVLALARRDLPPRAGAYTVEKVEQGLTLLGLVAMMDPPRPEVAGAVQRCREGGVRIVMITGDYGLTAESMARRVGMLSTANPVILTGADVEAMTDAQLQEVIGRQEIIFARMAPDHKLRLVSCFQARGDVVAVIGDGVNDAPALRKADIGIAMGIAGTDVAKEAADLILMSDDFSAIAAGIEEGRTVYDNLRKFVLYIFASNIPEILPFVLAALVNIPLALSVRQILAIDLGTDLLPALALGTDPPEPEVMRRSPRKKGQTLLDARLLRRAFLWLGLIEAALCYLGFALVYLAFGQGALLHLPAWPWLESLNPMRLPLRQVHLLAVTVFFAGVVLAQVGNAFAVRAPAARSRPRGWLSNFYLVGGVLAEALLVLALVYFRPLNELFGLHVLPPAYWLGLLAYAPLLYLLDRARGWFGRKAGSNAAHEGGMSR
jgi:magnesium-transporting ATPase (P-type)